MNYLVIPTILLALVAFFATQRFVQGRPLKIRLLVTGIAIVPALPGLCLPLQYLHLFEEQVWYCELRSFPFSELTAAGAGVLAGAIATLIKGPRAVSAALLLAFLCAGIMVPHIKPLIAPLDHAQLKERTKDRVCLQSSSSTCGPASTATVLRSLGLKTTEAELAHECHSYAGGTENWYLARAIRKRGFVVHFRMEAGYPNDLKPPAIAGIKMGGVGHFVAVLNETDGTVTIGEPLAGRLTFQKANIQKEIHFTGFFMEIAKP